MRAFTSVALIAVVAVHGAADEQTRGFLGTPPFIWEVGPALEPVESMEARVAPSLIRSAARSQMRTPENCVFPLDVVILQDATDSFSDNIASMTNTQLDLIYNGITTKHPDSRFGVVSFKDKPVMPFGNRDDYCSRVDAKLGSDLAALKTAYGTIKAYGGADAPENQFGTIYNALDSAAVGWSAAQTATKLVIVSTDAGPHFAGDAQTGSLPPFDIFKPQDENLDICLAQYYPSAEQVKAKVAATGAYVASLVYDGDWANGWPSKSWMYFNTFIGQSADFIAPQAPDSSDFWAKLAGIIAKIEEIECKPLPPTPVPVVTTVGTPETTTPAPTPTPTTPKPVPTTVSTNPAVPIECVCPCNGCACCPEVSIKLLNRPKELHLSVTN